MVILELAVTAGDPARQCVDYQCQAKDADQSVGDVVEYFLHE